MTWAPDYITPDQLKTYLRIPLDDTLDDGELDFDIASASRAIDRATRRQFGNTDLEARLYTPEYDRASGRYVVRTDDIAEAGEDFLVEVDTEGDGTWTAVTDYILFPLNAAAEGRPWERLTLAAGVAPATTVPGTVRVTAVFGWAEVPATIQKACLMQAARFYKRRDAVFGNAGNPEMGSEIQLRDKVDADVAVAVRSYRRQVWA